MSTHALIWLPYRMVNQNILVIRTGNSHLMKHEDTEYTYKQPIQTTSAAKALVMATP
jgi:hypothetical protein